MDRNAFMEYLEEAIGHENALRFSSSFDGPESVSVRKNPFKPSSSCVPDGSPVPWCSYGVMLPSRPVFTLDPFFHAGAYYVQDSSSMFVGHAFRNVLSGMSHVEGRPVRVLDLCAAPGGKTTDLAASLREYCGNGFVLVSNEVMKQRVQVLSGNVALWGDPNVYVTSEDPARFAGLEGYFDIILADVPCSGEGMFRKDAGAMEQWSKDNVALCESRQRRIIADVWPSLKEGGILIYSTCTFNRYENDGNVAWIAENLGAEPLTPSDSVPSFPGVLQTEAGYSLVPGLVEGEGQYCSVIRKTSPQNSRCVGKGLQRHSAVKVPGTFGEMFDREVRLFRKGDLITAVPEAVSDELPVLEQVLRRMMAGCAVGELKKDILVPSADLALTQMLRKDSFPSADLDRETALAFLHGDTIRLPESAGGYLKVCYGGLALGFVKNLGNRCNNLHPQGRRIRMDIRQVSCTTGK